MFHFRRAAFSAQLKAKVGSTLTKAAAFRINLNIDGVFITNPVYPRRVDSSDLVFSLSSYREVHELSGEGYVARQGYQVSREKLHSS